MTSSPTLSLDLDLRYERLRERLVDAARLVGLTAIPERTSSLAHELLVAARTQDSGSVSWLVYVALSGCMPTAKSLATFRRKIATSTESAVLVGALDATLDDAIASRENAERSAQIVEGGILVDVSFCASYEHNTGIQRVVRETVPRWLSLIPGLILVVWSDDNTAYRTLTPEEADRVLNWNDRKFPPSKSTRPYRESPEALVPWNSTIFVPEVPQQQHIPRLHALAQSSGNDVMLIGYDAIPAISGFAVSQDEAERFATYLSLVKHSKVVVGISESASEEFRGFVDTLPAQGLVGPVVPTVLLPVDVPHRARVLAALAPSDSPITDIPLVVCIGSHEPRKNQESVLHAAEFLLREGHRFEMVFVGRGMQRHTRGFDQRVRELAAEGLPIRVMRSTADGELWELYGRARFSVFVSLHEGYGLPVAESLALGTPVLTSNFGSLAEIATTGGCIMVDPRDDDQIVGGMRRMLTDDNLIDDLIDAIHLSPRTWDDYAREVLQAMGAL